VRNWVAYIAELMGASVRSGLPLPPAPILPEFETLINPLGENLSQAELWARFLQLLQSYDPTLHQSIIQLRWDPATQQWFRVPGPMLQNLRELA
jgi:hypothetical protein